MTRDFLLIAAIALIALFGLPLIMPTDNGARVCVQPISAQVTWFGDCRH